MMSAPHIAGDIPAVTHDEAMALTAVENARLLTLLRQLDDRQWAAPTDCTGWSVRDVTVHLIASAEAQASPVEFLRQLRTGRKLTAEIGGHHWVDGLNEAQLRARKALTPTELPDLWDHHAARALAARRKMPAPVRALRILPIGEGMGTYIGWQPLSYLFDTGFTRDVWMHRIDIARAAGVEVELTAEHDGRLVADILAEWSSRHGEAYDLTLTGPAGGHYAAGDPEQRDTRTLDAVEFVRVLAGRADGPGVLAHKLPL